MKKIFSFFIFFIFTIIVFFQNPMMSFAMQEMNMNTEMKMEMKDISGCCDNDIEREECNHECCYKSEGTSTKFISNNTRENNKKLKLKIKNFIDIFSFSLNLYNNKNLTKITSPPNFIRKFTNYSYKDLTKIIKSNT